ncbi:hypothetical protein H310_09436 [Aphanomyces invadans]|uniref:Uncharacterized protein n=1 Tax=Aphanomyces invadans TaxID=157072 RepID=A0A024TU60_9STRA|nr:hypothetical protein H310_09436 [Aphanomyces invadans]ETV97519.1 hypothetical protein H310_09436 [Aphanomyces invadans]|eukprot:XP_008873728.1 hypothetical protein H310_09436 [Aphanomyces invadans]
MEAPSDGGDLALLADMAKMELRDWSKQTRAGASDQLKALRQGMGAASRARAKARADRERRTKKREGMYNPHVIQAKAAAQLQKEELTKLMKDVNALLRKERKNLPQWIRKYKDEDPRCVYYHSMLRRVGLPERHARFAPWFLKSNQLVLNKYGQKLFDRFEAAYLAQVVRLSDTEAAIQNLEAFAKRVESLQLGPREQNQSLLQRAFRTASFPPPRLRFTDRSSSIHPLIRNDGSIDDDTPLADIADKHDLDDPTAKAIPIAPVKVAAAPPGLAPAVPGKVESHGKHLYHAYNGRWKDGHMRGPVGVYEFADGGKYTGAWKDSVQCGMGTAEYPNGTKYVGQWKDGKYHGQGTWSTTSGVEFVGEWKNGMREGKGRLQLPSGAVYDGEFYKNQRHGLGVESSPLGYKYKGTFRMNRIYGQGQIEIEMDNGKVHVYAKDQWQPCLLGEAAMEAKMHWLGIDDNEEVFMRRLMRVRDDFRADDLQEKFHVKEAQRIVDAERARKQALREANKDKREALARAKEAFKNRILQDNDSDDVDESMPKPRFLRGDDDGDDDDESDDESDDDSQHDDVPAQSNQ